MLRSLWLLFMVLAFLGLGTASPFILALGYVWVDTFKPQDTAYIILDQLPLAMIMGAAAVGSYFVFDRREPPRLTLAGTLLILIALWCTLTLAWAVSPDSAWVKWNWAFKTLAFAAFLPLVIRSRLQIEAMAQVYLFALAGNFIPFGIKTMINGGGYGINLGIASGNSGLAEGGLLSTFCLMAVPIALYLRKHSLLIPKTFWTSLAYLVVAILALVTAIGTYERSALIGLGFMGVFMFLRSRRKMVFGTFLVIGAVVLISASTGILRQRMQTIETYHTDVSALTRLAVWRWTFNFSLSHPFGGGFNSYENNVLEMPPDSEHPGGWVATNRAFHSIYFEVLGELGYPGLFMFLAAAISTMLQLRRLTKRVRNVAELAWCADLADALRSGLIVFLTAGAFVGIAFQPIFWYFIALSISVREFARRVEARQAPLLATGWRAARQTALPAGGHPLAATWRRP